MTTATGAGTTTVTTARDGIRVAAFPRSSPDNPYQSRLEAALAEEGVRFNEGHHSLTPRWILANRRQIDVVHLHWLEFLTFDRKRRLAPVRDLIRGARLIAALEMLKRSRIGVVWTVHNLAPHEPPSNRLLWRCVLAQAKRVTDSAFVHSKYARRRLVAEQGEFARIHVTYHGNFFGSYPEARRPRADVRSDLGIPADAYVYLMFGGVRRYKRIVEAIEAFSRVDGDDLRLVVAGRPAPSELGDEIRAAAARDPRVVLLFDFIPDEEVADLFNASDAAVINYADVFSSSAVLLALSYGLPIVAPAATTAEEVTEPEAIAPFSPGELDAAIQTLKDQEDRERRRSAALASAGRYTWTDMAQRTVTVYREAADR